MQVKLDDTLTDILLWHSATKPVDGGKKGSFGRKAVSFVLITVTGGVALSALDDLAIYHGCSRYAPFYVRNCYTF